MRLNNFKSQAQKIRMSMVENGLATLPNVSLPRRIIRAGVAELLPEDVGVRVFFCFIEFNSILFFLIEFLGAKALLLLGKATEYPQILKIVKY